MWQVVALFLSLIAAALAYHPSKATQFIRSNSENNKQSPNVLMVRYEVKAQVGQEDKEKKRSLLF